MLLSENPTSATVKHSIIVPPSLKGLNYSAEISGTM